MALPKESPLTLPLSILRSALLQISRRCLPWLLMLLSKLFLWVEPVLAKVQELGGYTDQDQKQIWASSWWINHSGSVQTNFYSRNRLLTVVNNNNIKGEGRGGLKNMGGLLTFFLWKWGGGCLLEDLRYVFSLRATEIPKNTLSKFPLIPRVAKA